MKHSLFVKYAKGKSSGKFYYALVLDLGYTQKYLAFGIPTISEILNVSPHELMVFMDSQGKSNSEKCVEVGSASFFDIEVQL